MEKSTLRKVTAVPFGSILMTLACQCSLFEEQFNKQSLAFHVEGKICNDIHLPGSASLACDWIRAAVNTAQVWVAPNASWVSSCMDKTGWRWRWGLWANSELCLHASVLYNYLRESNGSLQLVPGPLKEQPGNRGTLRAALRSGETESPETSLLTVSVEAHQQCLHSTHVGKGSFWVLCEVSSGKDVQYIYY